jgi:hypothetical protein
MKHLLIALSLVSLTALLSGAAPSSYNVMAVYQQVDVTDAVGYTRSGDFIDRQMVLKKVRQNTGTYSVRLRRIDTGLYEVVGTSLYVQLQFCHEFGTQDALLTINGGYGYSIGKAEFK